MNADSDQLRLTDFMDLPTLQEIQDSFASITRVRITITDASGNLLTQPQPTSDFLKRQQAIEAAEEGGPVREGREFVAPIVVNNHRLGTIRMAGSPASPLEESKLATLAEKFAIDPKQLKSLLSQVERQRKSKPAAIQFLFLLANAVARLCFQEYQLRQRINELTAVYQVSTLMAETRDVTTLLNRTVELVAEIMKVKASSIRLLDKDCDNLLVKAVYNLSKIYLNKGPIRLSAAEIDREALGPHGFAYVRNMATDPRVVYPQEAVDEGIVSMLVVGMRYKGHSIGVLRVYTAEEQHFSQLRIDLLKAVAAQAAAAIENARLLVESIEAERLEKQVQMAAEVQRRMMPSTAPKIPGIDLASVYIPCFELGGDFVDFIPLPDNNIGLVVADVAGKGVPASLIMASVRASLRAQVDNLYYLYEILRRVNQDLCRDTEPSEFVTLLYGVINITTRRFTYCNAGHPPGLLMRGGEIMELPGGNMVLGVSPDEEYTQSFIELQSGDVLLLYTDGVAEAMNYSNEIFGRQRIVDALRNGGTTASEIANHILWEIRRFSGLRRPTDDVTMIVARIE